VSAAAGAPGRASVAESVEAAREAEIAARHRAEYSVAVVLGDPDNIDVAAHRVDGFPRLWYVEVIGNGGPGVPVGIAFVVDDVERVAHMVSADFDAATACLAVQELAGAGDYDESDLDD
jgi:hypothetical protein